MPSLYQESHRAIQAEQHSEQLAALLDVAIMRDAFDAEDIAFIGSRDFLFLATVDGEGRPTVSYKGGAPGFVRVAGPASLVFPLYDGNGMFLSAGNVAATAHVGLLFIDLETPHRLRVQGSAELQREGLAEFPGARLLVRVAVSHVFVNCGRYIHPHRRVGQAPHVPDAHGGQPIPVWKRIDLVQPVLPDAERQAACAAGLITSDEYTALRKRGEV